MERGVDRASKNRELKIKEALHIQMTHNNNKFNRAPRILLFTLCYYNTTESSTSVDP